MSHTVDSNRAIAYDRQGVDGMRHRMIYPMIAVAVVLVGTLAMAGEQAHLQANYADEVVRFHVIANSDSEEDQELKLQVRNRVGSYVSQLLEHAGSKQETIQIMEAHVDEIAQVAADEMEQCGYHYPVTASVEQVDFPEKTYGDYHLPEGTYTSLQIRIGEAAGANWWCVMYPNMCFMDNTYEIVDDGEKEQMYQVFTLYEYKKLIESPDKEMHFRYLTKLEDTLY